MRAEVDQDDPSGQRILLVEVCPGSADSIGSVLSKAGYDVLTLRSNVEPVTFVAEQQPDLIVLETMCPSGPGADLCRALKSESGTQEIPVMFVSELDTTRQKVAALDSGAEDYISNGCDEEELLARVRAVLRTKARQDQCVAERADLATKAVTDSLTGVYNRRHILSRLKEEIVRSRRHGLELGCLMADIDHFKRINDTFGHAAGDQALRQVTRALRECLRASDVLARYGGEEFLAILPETSAEGARAAAEKLREHVERTELSVEGQPVRLTVSVGVTAWVVDDMADSLVGRADRALYEAKRRGRNRVVLLS